MMNTKHIVALFLVLRVFTECPAQQNAFGSHIPEGDQYFRQGKYTEAMRIYLQALSVEENDSASEARINAIAFKAMELAASLNDEKHTSDTWKWRAISKADSITMLRSHLNASQDSLCACKESLEASAQELHKAKHKYFHVMDSISGPIHSLTPAHKKINGKSRWYFINSSGEQVEKLGTWDYAMEFNDAGIARVWNDRNEYLLDTAGTRHLVSKGVPSSRKVAEALDLGFMKMRRISRRLFNNNLLVLLIAPGNKIRHVPPKLNKLNRLQYLDLGENRIRRIRRISRNKNIEKLDLHENRITKISRKIAGLDSLAFLDLSYNRIRKINNHVSTNPNTKRLDLCYNRIRKIPRNLYRMQNLEYLGLTGNKISAEKMEVALDAIGRLGHLKELRIGDNPCSNTPEKRDKIKRYFIEHLPNCRVEFN